MKQGYRFIKDLTSDVMFEATGTELAEVFTNSAYALFDMSDLKPFLKFMYRFWKMLLKKIWAKE